MHLRSDAIFYWSPTAIEKIYGFTKQLDFPIIRNNANLRPFVARHQFHTAPIFFRCSSTRAESVASSLVSVGSGVA